VEYGGSWFSVSNTLSRRYELTEHQTIDSNNSENFLTASSMCILAEQRMGGRSVDYGGSWFSVSNNLSR
jgi:hypothetical protein